jgi:hypothetical protein
MQTQSGQLTAQPESNFTMYSWRQEEAKKAYHTAKGGKVTAWFREGNMRRS